MTCLRIPMNTTDLELLRRTQKIRMHAVSVLLKILIANARMLAEEHRYFDILLLVGFAVV